jgi:hypothetical protein
MWTRWGDSRFSIVSGELGHYCRVLAPLSHDTSANVTIPSHRYVQIVSSRLEFWICGMTRYVEHLPGVQRRCFALRGGATSESEQGRGVDGVPDQVDGRVPNPTPVPHGLHSVLGVQKRQPQRIRPFVPLVLE